MLTKKQRENTQLIISEMKEEKALEILWTIEENYEQVYAQKFDKLDEMDRFFKRDNLSKLTQEVDNLSRLYLLKKLNQY